MNRLIVDPISCGVIVTDGGNKKVWAIGPEGQKRSVQYRPWRKIIQWILSINILYISSLAWSVGFLTTNTLVILHAGCLTFHAINSNKQLNNEGKMRSTITNAENL